MDKTSNTQKMQDFKGKPFEIRRQYENFWKQSGAKKDARAYRKKIRGHVYQERDKWMKETTPFKFPLDDKTKLLVLEENRDFIILRNKASFDCGQYPDEEGSAGMSGVHLLMTTKPRYFNGVSLTKRNAFILESMKRFFKKCWRDEKFRKRVVQAQKAAIHERYESRAEKDPTKATRERDEALEHLEKLKFRELKEDDFRFGLHLWPDNSVADLHLHIVAMPEEMREYSTHKHDAKTKDPDELSEAVVGPILWLLTPKLLQHCWGKVFLVATAKSATTSSCLRPKLRA